MVLGLVPLGMGESPCDTALGCLVHGLHQHLQVPCFHRVWLVRWQLLGSFGVVLYILLFIGSFFSVFEDNHSLMGGSDDTWSRWIGWNDGIG